MEATTFACPHCRNVMAVGKPLMGRNVRCPHCRAVVKAPAEPPGPPAAPEGPAEGTPPPAPGKGGSVPLIQLPPPPSEPHESIFGEVAQEDVFGGGYSPRPEMPPASSTPDTSPRLELGRRASDTARYPTPDPPAPVEPPATIWAEDEDGTAPQPAPFTPPLTPGRTRPDRGGGKLVTVALLLYSLAATGGLVYLLFFLPEPTPTPLETLPDLFGEYPPADRKKLSHEKLPAPTSALPRRLIVPLGRTIRVHDLEITPLRVSEQERYLSESKEGKPEQAVFPGPALALHLRLKNASREVYFHPSDPAFNRRYDPEEDGPPPYSYLRVGDDRYYGGPFDWPRKGARAYTPAQASDDRPLGPGEVRETAILSPPRTRFEDPVGRATSYTGGTMIWRVHLRTGLVSVGGKDYPVTSVIGVEFRNSDIREN